MKRKKFSKSRQVMSAVMAAAVTATTVLSGLPGNLSVYADEAGAVDHLIINQVYGGGGKGSTPIGNSFIELYNPTGATVNLSGYSIEMGKKTLTLEDKELPGGTSWLIVAKEETTTDELLNYELPAADQTWEGVSISNKNYTIVLKDGDDNEVDSVTADEDVAEIAVSKQKSLRRINYADTDTNADFEIITWEKGLVTVDELYLEACAPRNSKGEMGTTHAETAAAFDTSLSVSGDKVTGFADETAVWGMELYARYNSKALSADGGSMEIVEYNEANGYAYAVSGVKGQIVAIPIEGTKNGTSVAELEGKELDVKKLVEESALLPGFVYGDITSVAISPDGSRLAASIQHKDYKEKGVAAIFTYNEDGTLKVEKLIEVGVQPDMITFADNNTVLTADEGEPRNGYGTGAVDPEGTVSVVNIQEGTSTQAGFENYTADELAAKNILVGIANGEKIVPKYDMEPEYIAVSTDGKKAYVALQEANAIAVLDIENAAFTGIYPVGFEDYSTVSVDIVEDGTYEVNTYSNLVGARMPDGIAVYSVAGKDYLVTANEGDAREWGTYCNEAKTKDVTGENIKILDETKCAGLPEGKSVLFGGRGFSIFEISDAGLTEVFDSAEEFEATTAQYLPDYFNASNDDKKIDSRSTKKGPEPENVTIGQVKGKSYAFIAVERIGGIMVYDVTEPAKASFVNYINSREFDADIQGDVSPEGICFIPDAGNGKPVIAAACEVSGTVAFYELDAPKDLVVLYTNDVHNAYEQTTDKSGNVTGLGYAAVAQYKLDMEEDNFVELVDAGDAIQGGVIGALSTGEYLVDIMNETGYTLAVPGNHEFDFGMERFLELADKADYEYVSCNFIDLRTKEPVFDSYEMKTYGDTKVAYIGITTPETYTKSTPTFFQDENGNYIYGFCEGNNGQDLYNQVQKTIDAAQEAGADYIIAIGHAGVDAASKPWTSEEIIANTTGLDVFIDGHSHSTIASQECRDKDGNTVILSSTGTKLSALGKMVISADGTITCELVSDCTEQNPDVLSYVDGITEEFAELQNEKVAATEVKLVINDPVSSKRMIRNQETNLGDLCADAYRTQLGADIAFVNGGGIRVDVAKGDVTYGDIISVHPFGNMACLIEATGQQILDALELGASKAGIGENAGENGGFLQVSGLTYEIDATIPSSVVTDDKGAFVKVDGTYRVKNVMVGGKSLDLTKTYTLASHNYMLKSGGDGFTMFKGNKVLKDEVMVDNEVLINYIKNNLSGNVKADSIYANPYGEGRIRVITAYQAATETKNGYVEYVQGSTTVREVLKATGTTTQTPEQEDGFEREIDLNKEGLAELLNSVTKATDGEIKVILPETTREVPAEVFNQAAGKDVTLVFVVSDHATWSINAKTIISNVSKAIDMNVILNSGSIPASEVTALAKDKATMQLSLAHDGVFGFDSVLTLNVGTDKAGKYGNLYYYNPSTKKLEYQQAALINSEGNVTYTFQHASDYLIVFDDKDQKTQGTTTPVATPNTVPDTGDTSPIIPIAAIVLLGAAVAGYGLHRRKHS